MITRTLNPQALAIEDAEMLIKDLLLKGYLSGKSKAELRKSIDGIVKRAKSSMTSPALVAMVAQSLYLLADKTWATLIVQLGVDGRATQRLITRAVEQPRQAFDYDSRQSGIATFKYNKDYMAKVREVFNELAGTNALDLDDVSGHNSLRNKAEMVVRYEYHQQQEQAFKDKGVNLVVCSVHTDCSKRCAPYQGKIYSLDGTSGRTEDGREYKPLEYATQNPRDLYTTKAGKTYQNGLFGFNCRHRLYEYKSGMQIPTVSSKVRKREDAINTKQRQFEASIRAYRQRALFAHTAGYEQEYSKMRKKAIELNKQYIAFSQKNNRAYYPDRVKIFN